MADSTAAVWAAEYDARVIEQPRLEDAVALVSDGRAVDAASHIAKAIESLLESPSPWKAKRSLMQLMVVLRAELDRESSLA